MEKFLKIYYNILLSLTVIWTILFIIILPEPVRGFLIVFSLFLLLAIFIVEFGKWDDNSNKIKQIKKQQFSNKNDFKIELNDVETPHIIRLIVTDECGNILYPTKKLED